jgi:valyl-tRNA synthetase
MSSDTATAPSPTADLPKQYHHKEPEARWYRFWEERGYFQSDPDPRRTPYTIVIPPPNVTGALHLGHALNNTLQDILIRFKRMQGYNALWIPGTDHAGIATQAVVERRLLQEEGLSRHDLGRERLVQRIWQWKDEYEARILMQLKRMGCSCDWRRTRFTLDPICARAVRHTFFALFRDGLIYRGKRLVNWDTYLQTAISDDEVFHETVDGHFWHLRYPVIDPAPGEPSHVTVATTRPETMLGDTAVAVHPDPAAALDRAAAELRNRLAAAGDKQRAELEAELAAIEERRQRLLPELLALRDMARAGRMVLLPLVDRPIPLILDEWAKPELGSGCVKITPAHDPNDYEVGLRHRLPMINVLQPDGTLNAAAGPYQGLTIAEGRQRVVADLERLGLLAGVEARQIDLAHSDRSKTPIEPYLADQWFVRMEQLAQSAIDAVTSGRVQMFPPRYAQGYIDWLSEKRDWPVSRQLWWGHQIPIWYCRTASEADLRRAFPNRPDIAWRRDEENAQWLICSRDEDLPSDAIPGHELVREQDVLDTWFSSALWPHSTLGWPEPTPELAYYYPTSTLVTSRDIITLWVARMVLTGLYNVGEVPFRQVYIHPKILDNYGEGMSKSKGNGVDPLDVMEKFGGDALRFGLAYLTTETQDVRMAVDFECPHCGQLMEQTRANRMLPRLRCPKCGGEFRTQWAEREEDLALPRGPVVSERFEMARNFCNKLWNAARFTLLNLGGYTPASVSEADLLLEDRWLLSRLATVCRQTTSALEQYRYAEAMRQLYEFAWDEFCSFYVEMIKARLQDAASRPTAQRILAHALDVLVRLLHPVAPFITEEIWQRLNDAAPSRGLEAPQPAAESVMIAPWPELPARLTDPGIEEQFSRFQTLLSALREIRSRQNIGQRATLRFVLRCQPEMASLLAPMKPYFLRLAGAEAAGMGPDVLPPRTHATVRLACGELYADLEGLIDVAAERARHTKERDKLLGQIAAKQKKLSNQEFLSRAPAVVVEQERQSLQDLQLRLAAVERVLADLPQA